MNYINYNNYSNWSNNLETVEKCVEYSKMAQEIPPGVCVIVGIVLFVILCSVIYYACVGFFLTHNRDNEYYDEEHYNKRKVIFWCIALGIFLGLFILIFMIASLS